ncbi:MAG: 4Fe-4S binding protein [Infirmifilum sp.]
MCASLKNCRLCLSSCPYDALSGKPPRPLEDRCLGCGLCASSCPQGLLVQPSAPPSALRTLIRLASEKGVQRLVVVCARGRAGVYEHLRGSPGKTLVVQLPCAASLRLHEYLYARLKGVTVTPYCPDPGCPAREAYLSYTSLLREADSTFNPAGAEPAGYTLPALAAALQPLRESTGLPLYDLHVDPGKCTLCGACARACRTGALVYSQDGARAALLFTQSRCVGCRDCEAVCPEHALTLVRRVNPERLKPQHVPVLEAPMAHCASCGAPIAPLPTLKAVEEKLRLKNAPEAVIQSLYLCPRCKQQQALAGYLKDLAHGREET